MQARGRKPGVSETLRDDNDIGSSFLDCAVEIAQAIDNLQGRSEVISLIAIKYVESGKLDVAFDLAETIHDSYQQDQTRAALAAKCIEVGAPDYAEKVCDLIEDDTAYALATEEMAVAYAESGTLEKAIALARRLTDSAPTLSRIALAFVAGGHSVQALEVAQSIDYPDLKAPVLVELAARALHDGHNSEASELLQEATNAAEEIEFAEPRISILVSIASLNGQTGQAEQALDILARAHRLCKESKGPAKDAALAQIAGGFAELHRYDQADQLIEEIENPFQFAHANVKVAIECYQAGDSTRALTLFADALEIGRDEEIYGAESLMMRETLLYKLAVCYATVGHREEGLQVIGMMDSQDQQHRALGEIAKLYVRTGNNSQVFEVIEMIKDDYARVLCEMEIVDAFIASDQFPFADHILPQSLARAATIERANQKASALMEIAPRLARREQVTKASEVLFEALNALQMIDDSYYQSLGLINLAGKYRDLGQQPGQREQTVLEAMTLKLET
jgi:tetratricopeptide (TPR) repeat protein